VLPLQQREVPDEATVRNVITLGRRMKLPKDAKTAAESRRAYVVEGHTGATIAGEWQVLQ
jgi:hypothetical protein